LITIGVELGARRYDVRVGSFDAEAVADALAAALPGITGAALLVDGAVGQRSPRVAPLLAALARRLPRVARRDLPAGEAGKNLTEIERTMEWLAAEGFDRRAAFFPVGHQFLDAPRIHHRTGDAVGAHFPAFFEHSNGRGRHSIVLCQLPQMPGRRQTGGTATNDQNINFKDVAIGHGWNRSYDS